MRPANLSSPAARRSSAAPAPATVPDSASPRTPGRSLLLGLLLVASILLAYQPAWDAGFIWDDDDYVTHNRLLTDSDGLHRIWFSTDSPSQYFPLVYTHFRVQRALWGLDPTGYHWVNFLLHAVNALLVWRLLVRLPVPGAWLAAAVFALHPLQVESVAWITELKNVQSLFFSLLAVLAWLRFTERSDDARPAWTLYAAALVCHALALFSKTTACTLPAALVLVLWIRHRPLGLARGLQLVPFVLLGLVMGFVSVWWERHHQGTAGDEFTYGAVERLLIAARSLCFYFGKFLWPENLTFSYPLWPIDPRSPAAYAWFLPLAGLAATTVVLRRRLGRGPEAGLVFFAATLLPLLGFFMLYTFRYTFVADHYVYVAVIGLAALVGAAAARLAPRLRTIHAALPAAAGTALVLTLGVLTWRQSRMYENPRVLWETTIARNPASFMAHNNLGAIRLAEGRPVEAEALFRRSLELKPDHPNALANLGQALLLQGRQADALASFQRVHALLPGDTKAHSDLAQVLLDLNRPEEALTFAVRALTLGPNLAETHFALGRCLLHFRQIDEAITHFQRTLVLYPEFAPAHFALAQCFALGGHLPETVAHLRQTLVYAPDHAEARRNLTIALQALSSAP